MGIPLKSGKTLEKERWRGYSRFCNGKSFSLKLSYLGYFSSLILVVYLILDTMPTYANLQLYLTVESLLLLMGIVSRPFFVPF